MANAILMSIHPKWAAKIYSGEKTVEWRKNIPNADYIDKVFLYETAPVCRVTGYFEYDHYYSLVFKTGVPDPTAKVLIERGCVPIEELKKYAGQKDELLGWKVKNPLKFDNPRTLADFGLKRPPQSWQYVEDEINGGQKMKTINRKKPISRAVLRGERLDEDCKRAHTIEEYGKCCCYGLIDNADNTLDKCKNCKAYVWQEENQKPPTNP